jgi:hypothetical protein
MDWLARIFNAMLLAVITFDAGYESEAAFSLPLTNPNATNANQRSLTGPTGTCRSDAHTVLTQRTAASTASRAAANGRFERTRPAGQGRHYPKLAPLTARRHPRAGKGKSRPGAALGPLTKALVRTTAQFRHRPSFRCGRTS